MIHYHDNNSNYERPVIEADDMRKLAQVLRGMADERRRTLGLEDDGTARALDHVASGIDLTLATESNGQGELT